MVKVENSFKILSHITDFGLKYCILKEDTKNNISGRTHRVKGKCDTSAEFWGGHL